MERFDAEQIRRLIQNEELVSFAENGEQRCSALKFADDAGNEVWSVISARDRLKVIEHALPQGFFFALIFLIVNAASFLRCCFPVDALFNGTIEFSIFLVLLAKFVDGTNHKYRNEDQVECSL